MLSDIFNKIDDELHLNKDDICRLLSIDNHMDLTALYDRADKIRKKYVGDEIHLRGLIEFSNYCRNNCRYCGIRRDNKKIKRYRMTIDEIAATAVSAEKLGYKTIVLQSGEDVFYTVEKLETLIKAIKLHSDVAITLSIGERPYEEYVHLYKAGADRFLLRFETSNCKLYNELHPDSDYDHRIEILSWLKEIGYQVGSGIMVGLPGQTIEDLAQDILKFKEVDLDMVGIGPYICHNQTPLAGNPNGDVEMTFKVIALTRIVTLNSHIPATTALATLRSTDGREKALQLGANVVMPNVTPMRYRALYELYPSKICINEDEIQYNHFIRRQISALGRTIGLGYGHSLKNQSLNS